MPIRRLWIGAQVNSSLIRRLSEFLPRTQAGPEIFLIDISLREISIAILARSLIRIISSEPIFIRCACPDLINLRVASIHSSINRKERVCRPSPQTSITPPSSHSATFLNIAAGAFSLPPYQVPNGPKNFVVSQYYTGPPIHLVPVPPLQRQCPRCRCLA